MKDDMFKVDSVLLSSSEIEASESHGRLVKWGTMPDNKSDISNYFTSEIGDNIVYVMEVDTFVKHCNYIISNAMYQDNLFKTRVIDVLKDTSYENINLDPQFATEGIIYNCSSDITNDIRKFLYYYAVCGLIDTYYGELWNYKEALSVFDFIYKEGFVLETMWYDKSTIEGDYSNITIKLRSRKDCSMKIITVYVNAAKFATIPNNVFMDVLVHYYWKVESIYDKLVQLHNKYSGDTESDIDEDDFPIDDYWDEDYGDMYENYSGEYDDDEEYEDGEEVLYNGGMYRVGTTESNEKEGEISENVIMGSSKYDPYKPAEY